MVPISTGATMATGDGLKARKSLGQHWLVDNESLESIIELANISKSDTVLEIGPGTGNLTKLLTKAANKVVGVELDNRLANHLKALNISNLSAISFWSSNTARVGLLFSSLMYLISWPVK